MANPLEDQIVELFDREEKESMAKIGWPEQLLELVAYYHSRASCRFLAKLHKTLGGISIDSEEGRKRLDVLYRRTKREGP